MAIFRTVVMIYLVVKRWIMEVRRVHVNVSQGD